MISSTQYATARIRDPNTLSTDIVQTETTKQGLRSAVSAARAAGKRIAFVPTMGYLHEGHLQLVDQARTVGDYVVMSIFVNPLQFGPKEDLAQYPRDLVRDSEMAAARGVDLMFAPSPEEMYEGGRPAVTVVANQLADKLCGHYRPGHFEGVLTVVAKLFNIVQPDVAVFGAKDFQQCVVIKRMVTDLDMPIEILIAPTVREADGLAMSSRNVYLSEDERKSALLLSRALRTATAAYEAGDRDPEALRRIAAQVMLADPGIKSQYLELVDPATLETPATAADDSVMAVAAHVGKTRLIDNMSMANVG